MMFRSSVLLLLSLFITITFSAEAVVEQDSLPRAKGTVHSSNSTQTHLSLLRVKRRVFCIDQQMAVLMSPFAAGSTWSVTPALGNVARRT
jgi:hypothetical protein